MVSILYEGACRQLRSKPGTRLVKESGCNILAEIACIDPMQLIN